MFQNMEPMMSLGEGENYAMTDFETAPSDWTAPKSFTGLKGTPKAALIIINGNNGITRLVTNINPTTGVIDNNDIYYNQCANGGTPLGWTPWGGSTVSFTPSAGSLVVNIALIGIVNKQMLVYTY